MDDPVKEPIDSKDAAWATINTPLEVYELIAFCQDIERLFRINPMLHFKKWTVLKPNGYHFIGQNISQETPFDFDLTFTVTHLSNGLQIDYQQGLKTRTTFIVDPVLIDSKCLSRLTITDSYGGGSEQQRQQHLHLVDKSITIWADYLQQYLQSWKRWSHISLWRWYMRRVWQPMKPAGRRITYILLWIAGFEIFLLLFGVSFHYFVAS